MQAPPHLETRLRAAFREQARRSSRWWRTLAWGTAVAALVLIGWLVAERPWRRSLPASSANVNTHVAVPTAAPRTSSLRVESNSGRGLGTLKARRTVPKHVSLPAGVSAESEAANGFIALPYGDSDYAEGGGMMVRVQLPRSAPAMVGLPMTPGNELSGPVTADVVLGQDGMARAIRFISPDEGGALPGKVNFSHEKNQGEPQ